MKKLTHTLVAVAALSGAFAAQAATVIANSNVIANAKISNGVLDLSQFNSSLGTLQSVTIDLYSAFSPTMRLENTSGTSGSVITASATEKLVLSTGAKTLATLQKTVSHTFNAPVFDGNANYGGTSGEIYAPNATVFSTSSVFTDVSTLALFSGLGVVHTSLIGTAASQVDGTSGNTKSLLQSAFSGYAKVTYTYVSPIPEPGTYAMLLAGLGLVGAVVRRRKSV